MGPIDVGGGGKTSRSLGRSIMQEGRKRVEGAADGGVRAADTGLESAIRC